MDTPMTVAELIEKLKEFDQGALVWLECVDPYYSGPLQEIDQGTVVQFDAHDGKDYSMGRERTVRYDAGWTAVEAGEPVPTHIPVISTHKGIIIRVE